MAKRTKDIGHIRLSELKHEVATKAGVQGIFIPFNPNPCIYVNTKDGKTTVDLDVEVIPTPNSKYSNKMVKASLPKSYREQNGVSFDSDRYKELTPILGNLKTYEFDDQAKGGAQAQTALGPDDDLPEGLNANGEWGGPIQKDQDWK